MSYMESIAERRENVLCHGKQASTSSYHRPDPDIIYTISRWIRVKREGLQDIYMRDGHLERMPCLSSIFRPVMCHTLCQDEREAIVERVLEDYIGFPGWYHRCWYPCFTFILGDVNVAFDGILRSGVLLN